MSTFSNTPYDADLLSDLYSILSGLPNNTANLIKPKNVRDSVFTIWENILFKNTSVTGSTYSYFGLDDPNSKTIFYFGKKELSGSPIMNNTLLTADSDFFFYNNKSDIIPSQQDTKISFLAGASSSDYTYAPYILAKKITSPSRIDLQIINPATGGSIDIGSTQNNVSLSGVIFPHGASATVGNSLVYIGSSQLAWTASTVLLASANYIPVVGTGGGLFNSGLKQIGNSVQVINSNYISDQTGLLRMDFMTGSGIQFSTDGGVLYSPNLTIDPNQINLLNPNGQIALNNRNVLLDHININLDSTNMFVTSSYLTFSGNTILSMSSSSINLKSSNFSLTTSNINVTSSNISLTTSNINITSSNISLVAGNYLNTISTSFTYSVGTYSSISSSSSKNNISHFLLNNITTNGSNIITGSTNKLNSTILVTDAETTRIGASGSLTVDAANFYSAHITIHASASSYTYSTANGNPTGLNGYTLCSDSNGFLKVAPSSGSHNNYALDNSNLSSPRTYILPNSAAGEIILADYTQVLTNKTLLSTASNIVDATLLQTVTISTTLPTKTATSTKETLSALVYDGTNWTPNKVIHYEIVQSPSGSGTFVTMVTHSMSGAFVGYNVYQEDLGTGGCVSYNADGMATLNILMNTSNDHTIGFILPKSSTYKYHIILYKGFDAFLYAP